MLGPGGAFFDPLIEDFFLLFREREFRLRRRHHLVAVFAPNSLVQVAFFQVPGNDRKIATEVGAHCFLRIEPEFGLLILRIGTMTIEAAIRKNGTDVAIEIDLRA